MTPEKRVQNAIVKFLEQQKVLRPSLEFFRREAGGFAYKKGLPDIWLLYRGIHVEIEVKDESGFPGPLQLKWEQKLKAAGAVYWRGDDPEDFKKFFLVVFQSEN